MIGVASGHMTALKLNGAICKALDVSHRSSEHITAGGCGCINYYFTRITALGSYPGRLLQEKKRPGKFNMLTSGALQLQSHP